MTTEKNQEDFQIDEAAQMLYEKGLSQGADSLSQQELLMNMRADNHGSTVAHFLSYSGVKIKNKHVRNHKNKQGLAVKTLYKAGKRERRGPIRKFLGDSMFLGKTDGKLNFKVAYSKYHLDTSPITSAIPAIEDVSPKRIIKELKEAKKFSSHEDLLNSWNLIDENGEPDRKLIKKVINVHKVYIAILSVFSVALIYSGIKNAPSYLSWLSLFMLLGSFLYLLVVAYRYDTLKNKKRETLLEWLTK